MTDFTRKSYDIGFGQGRKHTLTNGTWTAAADSPAVVLHFLTDCTPTVLEEEYHTGTNTGITYGAGDKLYGVFTKITVLENEYVRIYY